MKKIRIVAPALALSLVAFCSCAGTRAISLSANWNKDTTLKEIDGTLKTIETLVYDVTYEATSTESGYGVEYTNGVYQTTLQSDSIALSSGEKEHCYHLHTQLDLSVTFLINGQRSETFQDTMTSDVWFRNVSEALQPVKSTKSYTSHTPVSGSPESFDTTYYALYTFSGETVYDNPLSEATVKQTFTQRGSDSAEAPKIKKEKTVSVSELNFFDNEQILFALRALDMSSAATVKTINPSSPENETSISVSAPTAAQRAVNFTLKSGDAEAQQVTNSIDAYETSIVYSSSMSGNAQTLVYAAKTNDKDNTYRNVLLYMETPLSFDMGTLKYSLKSATFADR